MSHRGDLTARLVELQLLLAEGAYSQRELIAHFGVDRKTIKRAIDALSVHYQISEEPDGREVRYRFSDGYIYRPPTFTPSELAVLLLAQESIAATGVTTLGSPLATHARTLLLKVHNALPEFLRDKLDALASVYGTATVPAKDFSAHAETIDQLTDAAIEQRRVRLRYHSLSRDAISEHLVEPLAVYFDPDGATIKLIALVQPRQTITPFSIDRVISVTLTEETFTRPADFNLQQFLIDNCFNGIHGEPLTVRLRAHSITARIFAERVFHPSQRTIERNPKIDDQEETTTIELRVAGGRGLVRFILSWAPDVEVLAPEELRREVAEAYRQSLARSPDAK